jgi:hypothetical protein
MVGACYICIYFLSSLNILDFQDFHFKFFNFIFFKIMNVVEAPAPAAASGFSVLSENASSGEESATTSSLLIRAVLIILLLALIGFNVFTYLDDITAWFSDTFGAPFRSVARLLGYAAADTVKTTVDVTAQGAKSAVDIAAGATTSGINVLQQTIEQGGSSDQRQPASDQRQRQPASDQRQPALEKALSHAKKEPPQPDDATSRTQRGQRSGKSGYCYIGEDRGFRSCIEIGEEDTCMSGDIFPTQAICINPRLRK